MFNVYDLSCEPFHKKTPEMIENYFWHFHKIFCFLFPKRELKGE
jgi:hypothetical protein